MMRSPPSPPLFLRAVKACSFCHTLPVNVPHTLTRTRAVLEGVNYGLRDSLELMRGLGLQPTQVRASGGGLKSALWRQMLADTFGAEIATVTSTEGAALLAGVGAGARGHSGSGL